MAAHHQSALNRTALFFAGGDCALRLAGFNRSFDCGRVARGLSLLEPHCQRDRWVDVFRRAEKRVEYFLHLIAPREREIL